MMKLGTGLGDLFGRALVVVILGGFLLLLLAGAQSLLMSPVQWWNGKCTEEYARTYRSKIRWLEPTCEMPTESAIAEDDIEVLQNQLDELKRQIEKTQELLKNSRRSRSNEQ